MLNEKIFANETNVRNLFKGYGSFGEIKGSADHEANTVFQKTNEYKLQCTYTKDEYGVISRKDVFTNISSNPISVKSLKSCFVFNGGEYEVYTQFNSWQSESLGSWQNLVSSVSVCGESIRTTTNGTPFMVLWNSQLNRGVAFHLMPKSAWEIKATRRQKAFKNTEIVVEMGISDYNFDLTLSPGEMLEMPEIICYEVRNKIHMDCYKLHNYMHTNYPRRELPVIYYTWTYRFDYITYENVTSQIQRAAELGVEYFFIDAGWFGKGDAWSDSVGDWEENTTSKLCGRMKDIADEVRKSGMKFGIWLEPERAAAKSDSVKYHGEYYMPSDTDPDTYFLDFANPDAREWMLGVFDNLIERYGIEYIKDDFNADMFFDPRASAFLKYHLGHEEFVKELRRRHPHIYFSSCASGGHRMELENYTLFDSSWPSDNESPHDEMRIYKDTILRLPPQAMERWVAVHSLMGYEDFYEPFKECNNNNCDRMVACGDGTWHSLVGVQKSFMDGYMTCGPVGFSCDLNMLSDKAFGDFKDFVKNMKENREFWKTAVARIICDTPTVTTYEYSDMSLTKVVIQVFARNQLQDKFVVIPELDATKNYLINGKEVRSGKDIMDYGIELATYGNLTESHHMYEVVLEEQ